MQTDHASRYANGLLESLGETARVDASADHPAIAWKRSGLLKTTRLMLPLPLASAADGVLMALRAISDVPDGLPMHGSQIVGERARLRETLREGRKCAGGYGRLMDTQDGRIALNLVRDDDWGLIPAWLEDYVDSWDGIEVIVKTRNAKELVERAAEIGLAVAKDELPAKPANWFEAEYFERAEPIDMPLIVDLSGLWAGPLASSLMAMTGACVIKVEGRNRPDGMRHGHEGFYALINAGKDCVALDFRHTDDLKNLKRFLSKADIVIEASRPRALRQLGIAAEDFVSAKPGMIWARLTAYGQAENRIGFGDDIGISAGLATIMGRAHSEPCFVGDAIADPVNGLHLALALRSFANRGGGVIIDMAMRDCLRFAMGDVPEDLPGIARDWQALADEDGSGMYPMRMARGEVKSLGADNEAWTC